MVPNKNFSLTEKCDLALRSNETIQYFHPVHRELRTDRRLNFLTVRVDPCKWDILMHPVEHFCLVNVA